jgi:hypothetical protein
MNFSLYLVPQNIEPTIEDGIRQHQRQDQKVINTNKVEGNQVMSVQIAGEKFHRIRNDKCNVQGCRFDLY